MTPTFDDFCATLKGMVEGLGQRLAPDDDWQPMLFCAKDDTLGIAPIDGNLFSSAEAKAHLTNTVIPALVQQSGAESVAMVTTAWLVRIDRTNPYDRAGLDPETGFTRVMPSQHPGRIEVVTIVVCDKDNVRSYMAEIARSAGPPTLGNWEVQIQGEGGMQVAGRIAEAIQFALGRVPEHTTKGMSQLFKKGL